MDLNGNRFMLLLELFRLFSRNKLFQKTSYDSFRSISCDLEQSDNPSTTYKGFVIDCSNDGILFVYQGRIFFNKERFLVVLKDSKYYKIMRDVVSEDSTLLID